MEVSWKTSVKALGLLIRSPQVAIRDMARNDLIENTKSWFHFLVARNKTSHTYDEDIALEVYLISQKAIPQFDQLYTNLQHLNK